MSPQLGKLRSFGAWLGVDLGKRSDRDVVGLGGSPSDSPLFSARSGALVVRSGNGLSRVLEIGVCGRVLLVALWGAESLEALRQLVRRSARPMSSRCGSTGPSPLNGLSLPWRVAWGATPRLGGSGGSGFALSMTNA
jgi:hypothetical protein